MAGPADVPKLAGLSALPGNDVVEGLPSPLGMVWGSPRESMETASRPQLNEERVSTPLVRPHCRTDVASAFPPTPSYTPTGGFFVSYSGGPGAAIASLRWRAPSGLDAYSLDVVPGLDSLFIDAGTIENTICQMTPTQ